MNLLGGWVIFGAKDFSWMLENPDTGVVSSLNLSPALATILDCSGDCICILEISGVDCFIIETLDKVDISDWLLILISRPLISGGLGDLLKLNEKINVLRKINADFTVKFIFFEKATKICEIFPLLLTTVHTRETHLLYLVHTVKSKGKISQNFVVFSEYFGLIDAKKSASDKE